MTGRSTRNRITTLSTFLHRNWDWLIESITVGITPCFISYQSELVTKGKMGANEACEIEIEHLINQSVGKTSIIASYGNLWLKKVQP